MLTFVLLGIEILALLALLFACCIFPYPLTLSFGSLNLRFVFFGEHVVGTVLLSSLTICLLSGAYSIHVNIIVIVGFMSANLLFFSICLRPLFSLCKCFLCVQHFDFSFSFVVFTILLSNFHSGSRNNNMQLNVSLST